MKMTNFRLKREWMESAALWKKSAAGWKKGKTKGISGWSPEECMEQVAAYTKMENEAMEKASKAPVKIVLYFEDGSTEDIV